MRNVTAIITALISFTGHCQEVKCDTLILTSGKEEIGIVVEIRPKEISYKKCNNPEGPSHVLDKKDVFMILNKNGTREVINNPDTQKEKKVRAGNVKRRSDFSFSLRRGYWNYERGWYNYNVSFYNLNGIGAAVKMATTWFVYDNKTKYKLGINANWFELGGDYYSGEYFNQTGTYKTQKSTLFVNPLNIGFTNSIRIGDTKSLEININGGASVFIHGYFDNRRDIQFGVNPELRFLNKHHVFSVDYHYTPEIDYNNGLTDYKFGFFAVSYGFVLKGSR